MEEQALVHYGILGMKWGVRRSKAELARARGKKTSDSGDDSDDKKQTTAKRSKSISEMSDDELRKTVQRLQLERQYRDLNPKQVSAGQKIVDKILKDVVVPAATEVGRNLLKEEFGKLAKEIQKKSKK